jgi:hypothetical protein
MLVGSRPPNASCVSIFGCVSFRILVGANGLHMINL